MLGLARDCWVDARPVVIVITIAPLSPGVHSAILDLLDREATLFIR
jgi:hypothetical protein